MMSWVLGKELFRWTIYSGVPVVSLGWIHDRDNRNRQIMAQRAEHIERSGMDCFPGSDLLVEGIGSLSKLLSL
ncbi:hypothetical protein D915_000605 [Fasciola hepatica]|uniref:Uncharacterized protein n=1 Tax=Fasciola hepatica TaxID=6192 RepID=A0A2H1CVN1_FASHE|nr:hypothetical protein D915_000605 [Fasciola hepatica]